MTEKIVQVDHITKKYKYWMMYRFQFRPGILLVW